MGSYVAAKSTIAAELRVPETCRHIITPDTYWIGPNVLQAAHWALSIMQTSA